MSNRTGLSGIQPKDHPVWINADSLRVGSNTCRGFVNANPSWRLLFKLSRTEPKVVTCAWDNWHETWSGATATLPVSPCQHHKFTLHVRQNSVSELRAADNRLSLSESLRTHWYQNKTSRTPRFTQLLLFSGWTHHVHLSPSPRTKFAYAWILNLTSRIPGFWIQLRVPWILN